MKANELKESKFLRDSRIEYFNRRAEKTAAQIKKVEKLMEQNLMRDDEELMEYEVLTMELKDLRKDAQEIREYIEEHNLYRYDEFTIRAHDFAYVVEGENMNFRDEITNTQSKVLRGEMRMASMCSDEKRFTVRVEYWEHFITYSIKEMLPEDASEVEKLIKNIYDERSGMITPRGKHTLLGERGRRAQRNK